MNARKILIVVTVAMALGAGIGLAETPEEQRRRLSVEFGDIPRVSADMAYVLFKQGKIIIVDAHPQSRHKEQHCYGSINFPEDFIGKVRINSNKNLYYAVY